MDTQVILGIGILVLGVMLFALLSLGISLLKMAATVTRLDEESELFYIQSKQRTEKTQTTES